MKRYKATTPIKVLSTGKSWPAGAVIGELELEEKLRDVMLEEGVLEEVSKKARKSKAEKPEEEPDAS